MKLTVTRSKIRINPDHEIVIPRFFTTGSERSLLIIKHVLELNDETVDDLLSSIYTEFKNRYKNIETIFLKHYDHIRNLLPDDVQNTLTENRKLLLGSYFTMEYSIEAAALFNPSIVEDPDQQGVTAGHKNVIVSFRATGESHISSLVFRRGTLDENAKIHFQEKGRYHTEGAITMLKRGTKTEIKNLLTKLNLPGAILTSIIDQLLDEFTYIDLEVAVKTALQQVESVSEYKKLKYDILSAVNTTYELDFPQDSSLSERVIFPVTVSEKNGIEDARFVRFQKDDGTFTYIATYTAYDGTFILPQLIITKDFCHFKISPLYGKTAINKNLALFPRKINGQYAMISRIDGMNNYIMFSSDLYSWEEAALLQQPKYSWEFIQIGNAGSPIETEKGWLVITHGVGPMRKYCLGASLFDIDDPTIELGRLKEPILVPNEEERYGYVPNVVYSCGSIIHGDKLFIPYAVSDLASSFATVPLNELLDEILSSD